tara:strand:- start:35086 stop:35844 length:759 start_codon:yes stop_codon:yes gene_type:complete
VDLATLIGLIGAFIIVGLSMASGGNIGTFVSVPSMMIVFGGSLLVVLSKFGVKQFFSAVKVALRAFLFKKFNPQECIQEAVEIASAARKGGLLSLEGFEIKDDFMKKGVQLLIDGHEPDVVKMMMVKDMNLTFERHIWGQKVFRALGDVAPAMGMIGTLVGLVMMLSSMEDPKTIGPAMAVALLTTLYGAIIATMFALPLADKLELRSTEERISKALVIDALLGIQAGQNPRVIEETLMQYMPSTKRISKED